MEVIYIFGISNLGRKVHHVTAGGRLRYVLEKEENFMKYSKLRVHLFQQIESMLTLSMVVKPAYSSSRINAHLMFSLFPENRKSIPKFYSGKKL